MAFFNQHLSADSSLCKSVEQLASGKSTHLEFLSGLLLSQTTSSSKCLHIWFMEALFHKAFILHYMGITLDFKGRLLEIAAAACS